MTDAISPSCHDGKCRNCDGDALDAKTDQITNCECWCHKPRVRHGQPGDGEGK